MQSFLPRAPGDAKGRAKRAKHAFPHTARPHRRRAKHSFLPMEAAFTTEFPPISKELASTILGSSHGCCRVWQCPATVPHCCLLPQPGGLPDRWNSRNCRNFLRRLQRALGALVAC